MERFTRVLIVLGMCLGYAAQASADNAGDQPRIKLEFRRAERKPAEGLIEATVAGTKDKVYLHKTPDATNQDVADAIVDRDENGQPMVAVSFTKEGAAKMARLSEQHNGKPLAILVDGKVISAPVVREKFSGLAKISGLASKEEAQRIVKGLKGK